MPRTLSASFRRSVESRFSGDVDLVFLTISHAALTDSIRLVSDTVNFVRGGLTFIGFPFDIQILTDDDSPPTAELTVQNVDQIIGEAVRNLVTAPSLKLELLSSADFDLTVTPRVPIGTPTVQYTADRLFLTNVKCDVLQVSGEIKGWDYLQRVWPGVRATQDLLPGLFR